MNESDTFLDDILDGVTTVPRTTPEDGARMLPPPPMDPARPRQTARLTNPDDLSDGPSTPHEPNGNGTYRQVLPSHGAGATSIIETAAPLPAPMRAPDQEPVRAPVPTPVPTPVPEPSVFAVGPAGTEVSAPKVDLPVAAPHDILGLPGEPDVSASHFDLANEVNGITVHLANAASGTAVHEVNGSTLADPDVEVGNAQSFAAIAREIEATVDGSYHKSRSENRESADGRNDDDRGSFYIRSSRRRRRQMPHRVAMIPAIGLVLLLVLGLAGEWEYMSRGHSSNSSHAGAVTVPQVPIVRLPRVNVTRGAGTLFQLQSSGSAASSPTEVSKPFTVAWTVRCTELPKTSSVQILFSSSGHTALDILIGVVSHSTRSGSSATLSPGTYSLVAHAPGVCNWTTKGIPRP